jgi:hypothetical protein
MLGRTLGHGFLLGHHRIVNGGFGICQRHTFAYRIACEHMQTPSKLFPRCYDSGFVLPALRGSNYGSHRSGRIATLITHPAERYCPAIRNRLKMAKVTNGAAFDGHWDLDL